jgi:hypothetical protein
MPQIPAQTSDEAIATWQGGRATFKDISLRIGHSALPTCRRLGRVKGAPTDDETLTCYEREAERHALEQHWAAQQGGPEAVLAGLGDQKSTIRRRAYTALWRERALQRIRAGMTRNALLAYYETHRDRFRRTSSRKLWSIFRRHDDERGPDATDALLRGLKRRHVLGESFESLARTYSHSETRATGGEVGTFSPGQLPGALEKAAFALHEGSVSEPIRLRSGSVLLRATDVVVGGDLPFESVRDQVQRLWKRQQLNAAIAEVVGETHPPSQATILSQQELAEALESGNPEMVVLDIDASPLTARQLQKRAHLDSSNRLEARGQSAARMLWRVYESEKNSRLLGASLEEKMPSELRAAANARAQQMALGERVDESIHNQAAQLLVLDDAALTAHFRANQRLFLRPHRFKVMLWSVPAGEQPVATMASMQRVHAKLVAGNTTLRRARTSLGGTLADIPRGERTAVALQLPSKAEALVKQLGTKGFTPPFHQGGKIHVVHVQQWEKPEPLPFEQVRDRVRHHLIRSTESDRQARVRNAALQSVSFQFLRSRAATLLASTSEKPRHNGSR